MAKVVLSKKNRHSLRPRWGETRGSAISAIEIPA